MRSVLILLLGVALAPQAQAIKIPCQEFLSHPVRTTVAAVKKHLAARNFRIWDQHQGSDDRTILPATTMLGPVLQNVEERPKAPFMADDIRGVITWEKLAVAITLMGPRFETIPGDRVAVMLPPSVGAVSTYYSLLAAGRTPVMINYAMGAIATLYQSKSTQYVLTSRVFMAVLKKKGFHFDDELEEKFIYLEDLKAGGKVRDAKSALALEPISLLEKLNTLRRIRYSRSGLDYLRAGIDKQPETAVVVFTSGSEDMPKTVALTQRNLVSNQDKVLPLAGIRESDRLIGYLPTFHVYGFMKLGIAARTRAPVYWYANPQDFDKILDRIKKYKITSLTSTPTLLTLLLRKAKPGDLDSVRMVDVGGEVFPPELYTVIRERIPDVLILQGYGMTETSPVLSMTPYWAAIDNTVGVPVVDAWVIVDPDTGAVITSSESNDPTPEGISGKFMVRGDSVFEDYEDEGVHAPWETIGNERYMATGDIVTFDGTHLVVVDRSSRFIKPGGEKISLGGLEKILNAKIGEGTVALIGTKQETAIAFVTVDGFDAGGLTSIIRSAGGARQAKITEVIRIDEIPTLPSGKTAYGELKKLYAAKDAAENSARD